MRNVLTRAGLLKLFLLYTALGLLQFWYRYFDYLARVQPVKWQWPLIEQLTGNYASLILLIVLIMPLTLRVRPDRQSWRRWVPMHTASLLLYSAAHTTMMWGSRAAIFPLLGLGPYDYGVMPIRYAMEFPTDLISYIVSAGGVVLIWRMYEASVREVQVAQLRAELTQAQLESLTLQLQPHFLFNALNAVAAMIYEDARKADIMLARLADYLRRTLKTSSAQQVPLAQELELLDLYVWMMKARFEDDLQLHITLGDDVQPHEALVPQLILQPIVENAIRHGFDPASAAVRVEVSVARANGGLTLSVRDHGRGLSADAAPRVGLANTRSRLEHLHGAAARLDITNAPDGGTAVTIQLPYHTV